MSQNLSSSYHEQLEVLKTSTSGQISVNNRHFEAHTSIGNISFALKKIAKLIGV
jgi:hypothetical protein